MEEKRKEEVWTEGQQTKKKSHKWWKKLRITTGFIMIDDPERRISDRLYSTGNTTFKSGFWVLC